MVAHESLGHDRVHEPKHITTSTTSDAGKVITASSTVTGVSVFRKLGISELDAAVSGANPITGWQNWYDGTYTTGSRRSLTAATRTKLTIDGTGSSTSTTYTASGSGNWWSTASNKITPTATNDLYAVEVGFKCAMASGTALYVVVDIDAGGSTGIVKADTKYLAKGTASDHTFAFNFLLNVNSDFKTNGAEIYVTAGETTTMYSIYTTITRLHKAS